MKIKDTRGLKGLPKLQSGPHVYFLITFYLVVKVACSFVSCELPEEQESLTVAAD